MEIPSTMPFGSDGSRALVTTIQYRSISSCESQFTLSEMASRKNPDGTISFITIVPGFIGLEFVVGENTLTLRDAQHEYVYTASAAG